MHPAAWLVLMLSRALETAFVTLVTLPPWIVLAWTITRRLGTRGYPESGAASGSATLAQPRYTPSSPFSWPM